MKLTSPNGALPPSGPSLHASNARTCSRTCSTEAADNTTRYPGNTPATRAGSGASPITTCAFVPENPNALTA
ncbi:hypothetical protein ACF061_38995, partial [Streptomyces sp. NPDC015220]|uniref:hypothetical protein n=1 Tax=Streptomyces sp. NPDC015220 TaxID=3364947 RepID=UPI0037022287